jgi:hypothetical protein
MPARSYVDQVLDSLYVIESSMKHFFIGAEMAKETGQKTEIVDGYYERAAGIASMLKAGQSWSAIQAAADCSRATIAKIAKRQAKAA